MRRTQGKRDIACAHCGGRRLVPLTFEEQRIEHQQIMRTETPVQARLKCVACGQLNQRRPSSLLIPTSIT